MAESNDAVAILQARAGSTRLPGKIHRPFGDGTSILVSVVEAVAAAVPHDRIVLATTTDALDDATAAVGHQLGLQVFRGSEHDVLARFADAVAERAEHIVVRVCADNPFLQPRFLKELVAGFGADDDYLSFGFADGTPAILSHIGLFAEALRRDTLLQMARDATSARHREHLTSLILDTPGYCRARYLPVPPPLASRVDVRLTVDTEEDFQMLSPLFARARAQGVLHDPAALLALIDASDGLREGMRHTIALNLK